MKRRGDKEQGEIDETCLISVHSPLYHPRTRLDDASSFCPCCVWVEEEDVLLPSSCAQTLSLVSFVPTSRPCSLSLGARASVARRGISSLYLGAVRPVYLSSFLTSVSLSRVHSSSRFRPSNRWSICTRSIMPSTMNHLYHTLAPLIVYTAFLVSLLAFLAPVPIFPERVNLLSVKIGSSSPSTSSNVTRRWVPDDAHPRRMVKRAAAAKTQAESKTDRAGFEIVYGPLGERLSSTISFSPSTRN